MVRIRDERWFYDSDLDAIIYGTVIGISNKEIYLRTDDCLATNKNTYGPVRLSETFDTPGEAERFANEMRDKKITQDYCRNDIYGIVEAFLDDMEHPSKYEPLLRRMIAKKKELPVFYFTYASDEKFPFHAGWTEVRARDRSQACAIFNAHHPPRDDSACVNCSWIYDEAQFRNTEMYKRNDNFGKGCVEKL